MTFEHADLRDDGTILARIDERVKGLVARVGQLESDLKDIRVEIKALEKRDVRTEIANLIVFGMAVLVLVGFFGLVVSYFQGRPPGAPVSIPSSGGPR